MEMLLIFPGFIVAIIIMVIYELELRKFQNKVKPQNNVHFYVARDKDGGLYLYLGKPVRGEISWEPIEGCNVVTDDEYFHKFGLCQKDFENLKWEDEPREVFITVK